MAEPTTVVLIDDHRTLLDLLSFAIDGRDDLAVLGTATTARDGLDLVERTDPDVVLLDYLLPDSDGIALAGLLTERHPRSRLVMLTACQDFTLIARAAAAGVSGLAAKSGALTQVLDVIRSARAGGMVLDPTMLRTVRLTDRPAASLDRPAGPVLTGRERTVLGLLDSGLDARAIARELSISLHTCRGYVKSILAKLDCHSQLEAVVAARRLGLLSAVAAVQSRA
jgi:DNA-binding NarL/FixJ family response regulator